MFKKWLDGLLSPKQAFYDPNAFVEAENYIFCDESTCKVWDMIRPMNPDYDAELGEKAYEFHDLGVEIQSTAEDGKFKISAMFFYFCGSPTARFKPFTGLGPRKLCSGMTVEHVIATLGNPAVTGGDFDHEFLGYQRPWLKYYSRQGVQLMVEHEQGKIWCASVGEAFY